MAYLNLDPDYFSHRKTMRLVAICGPGAELYPIKLWAYAAKHRPSDGVLHRLSTEEIEGIAGWRGKRGKLLKTLVRLAFVDLQRSGYVLHAWREHEGHIIALRVRAKRAAAARWGKLKGSKKDDAKPMLEHSLTDAPSSQSSLAVPAIPKPSSQEDGRLGERLFSIASNLTNLTPGQQTAIATDFLAGFIASGEKPGEDHVSAEFGHLVKKISAAKDVKNPFGYAKMAVQTFHKERVPYKARS